MLGMVRAVGNVKTGNPMLVGCVLQRLMFVAILPIICAPIKILSTFLLLWQNSHSATERHEGLADENQIDTEFFNEVEKFSLCVRVPADRSSRLCIGVGVTSGAQGEGHLGA